MWEWRTHQNYGIEYVLRILSKLLDRSGWKLSNLAPFCRTKYVSYEDGIPIKMKLRRFSFAPPEEILYCARAAARRAPFRTLDRNFPLFLLCLTFWKYKCAWCPHYNLKFFHRKNLLNAVILVGTSLSHEASNGFCFILKITEKKLNLSIFS